MGISHSGTVDAMLARDGLPEGGTNLVTLERSMSINVKTIEGFGIAYALTGL